MFQLINGVRRPVQFEYTQPSGSIIDYVILRIFVLLALSICWSWSLNLSVADFDPQSAPFLSFVSQQNVPFHQQSAPFLSAKCPFFTSSFFVSVYLRTGAPRYSKKIHRRTMSTLSLLWNSNKNKQYVATNTMRRPFHRHCRSDYAGNCVKNCTFIAVIE